MNTDTQTSPNKAQHSPHDGILSNKSGFPTFDEACSHPAIKDVLRERDALKAHADKLAEALRVAKDVLAERGIELKEITRTLANYEASQ